MNTHLNGSCLCGSVRFTITADPMMVGHCHCIDCRKSSGTGHCTHVMIHEGAFELSGTVKFFTSAADSGNLVSRGFCPSCGSPVYSRNAAMPGLVFPRASLLDMPDAVKPQMSVYASRAPAWDPADDTLPAFALMPPAGPGRP